MEMEQTYQNLYKRVKNRSKKNATMPFYNEKKQLYLETDASGEGLGLGASLLQVRDGSSSQGMKHLTMHWCGQ